MRRWEEEEEEKEEEEEESLCWLHWFSWYLTFGSVVQVGGGWGVGAGLADHLAEWVGGCSLTQGSHG